jgi:four helix bundle protein
MDSKYRAYHFALKIISFIKSLPNDMASQIMARQLLKAATSIGANIIEAQASSSRRDFINFFHHSLKSANETKYWLGLLKDSGKGSQEVTDVLMREAEDISNILGSSILTLKGKRKL